MWALPFLVPFFYIIDQGITSMWSYACTSLYFELFPTYAYYLQVAEVSFNFVDINEDLFNDITS